MNESDVYQIFIGLVGFCLSIGYAVVFVVRRINDGDTKNREKVEASISKVHERIDNLKDEFSKHYARRDDMAEVKDGIKTMQTSINQILLQMGAETSKKK